MYARPFIVYIAYLCMYGRKCYNYGQEVNNVGGKTSAESKNKYMAKAYDRLNIIVPKGKKDEIQLFAAKRGESVNGMINRLINAEMSKPEDPDQ